MSDPETYKSVGLYREESLYYELGYKFSDNGGKISKKVFNQDFIPYLAFVSLGIQFMVGISQIFTLLTLALIYSFRLTFKNDERTTGIKTMILLLAVHTIEYRENGIFALPGQIIQGQLTFGFWFLELMWIIIFGFQALISFQPYTKSYEKGKTVQAESEVAKREFKGLTERTEGTDYYLGSLLTLVNISRLQETMKQMVMTILTIFGIIVVGDLIIWSIVQNLGGGTNIREEYFISGMSLILYLALIGFSKLIFPDSEEEDSEDEDVIN
jgi:hypothetical protein